MQCACVALGGGQVVQLGVALSEVEDASQRIVLYYTDRPGAGTTEAASFKLGELTGKWERFTLSVQGAEVGESRGNTAPPAAQRLAQPCPPPPAGAPVQGLRGVPPRGLQQEPPAAHLRGQLGHLRGQRRGHGAAQVCGESKHLVLHRFCQGLRISSSVARQQLEQHVGLYCGSAGEDLAFMDECEFQV